MAKRQPKANSGLVILGGTENYNAPAAPGAFDSLILPGGIVKDKGFLTEAIRAASPTEAEKAEAFIRIERRKSEEIPLDRGDDEIVAIDPNEPLTQPFIPYDMKVANTAKTAHEASQSDGVRSYELPDDETPAEAAAKVRMSLGSLLIDEEDGHKVRITSEYNRPSTNQNPQSQTTQPVTAKPAPKKAYAERKNHGVVFKYNEDESLYNLIDYIGSTYSSHYAKKDGLQTLDVWDALGSSVETCRDTAIKYLMRFGEKQGRNHKDLEKAIHYITLMMYFDKKRDV